MADLETPFGSCVFCDDIRQEVGGKLSYIGVYQSIMYVPSFPIAMPKFGIGVTLNEPKTLALRRDWTTRVRVFLPGDDPVSPSFFMEIPPAHEQIEAIFQVHSALGEDPDVPPTLQSFMSLVLAPMNLKEAGRIKVRADYNGTLLRLGAMRVEQQPTPPSPTTDHSTA
jgi:hypothetical protein